MDCGFTSGDFVALQFLNNAILGRFLVTPTKTSCPYRSQHSSPVYQKQPLRNQLLHGRDAPWSHWVKNE